MMNTSRNISNRNRDGNKETAHEVIYHKGDFLYVADEPFRGVLVVISGVVKQYRLTGEGEEMVTGFCFPGEWCGLQDLSSALYTGYRTRIHRLLPGM